MQSSCPSPSFSPTPCASNKSQSLTRPSKSWNLFRIDEIPKEDFVAKVADFYALTAVPSANLTNSDLTQHLPAIAEGLSLGSAPKITRQSEAGVQFATLFVNDNPCFNFVTVDVVVHPVDSWWGNFITNKTPYRHRPQENKFLALGRNWTFADDLWAYLFERSRASGLGWWALATSNSDRCVFGVFAGDWTSLITTPVAFSIGDILYILKYWIDCAHQSDSPSSAHVERPGVPGDLKNYFPADSDEPLPPTRIARLLEQASGSSPCLTRNTRSRTVARKAFVTYDEKTGEPIVVPLGSSHVEEMRMKSSWMRTGDEVGWNKGTGDDASVVETVYGVTAEEGYNDPDMAMDADPCPGLSFESLNPSDPSPWSSRQNLNTAANALPTSRRMGPGKDETTPTAFPVDPKSDYSFKTEHVYRWHREHFSPQDDLDRSDARIY